MSIEALSWVLKLDIARSSEKFVLVCLANYADERGTTYPSVFTLMRDTGQDRKTVLKNLKSLCEVGMLHDTGHRTGRTHGVIVYELVGVPGSSTVHYVYKTTNLATGEFYVGKRSVNGDPALDPYHGSGRWVVEAMSKKIPLHKEIIEVLDTDVEARAAEMRLFKLVASDPLCKNEGLPAALVRGAKPAFYAGKSSGPVFPIAPECPPSSGPDIPSSGPVIPPKPSPFSSEGIPKTGHRTIIDPSKEASGKPKSRARAPADDFCPLDALLAEHVDEQVARDWLKLRKDKRAPVTQTVISGIKEEAIIAGLDLGGALRVCCNRGWVGLNASWLATKTGQAGMGERKSSFEKSQDAAARAKAMIFGRPNAS